MIELTWGTVRTESFQNALGRVASCTDLDFKIAYSASRILSKIKSELDAADDMYKKLLSKHADIDKEQGTYKVRPENLELWKKEVSEFLDTKFVIEKNKLQVSSLEKVKLSPAEILALEPIVYDLEVISGGKE